MSWEFVEFLLASLLWDLHRIVTYCSHVLSLTKNDSFLLWYPYPCQTTFACRFPCHRFFPLSWKNSTINHWWLFHQRRRRWTHHWRNMRRSARLGNGLRNDEESLPRLSKPVSPMWAYHGILSFQVRNNTNFGLWEECAVTLHALP